MTVTQFDNICQQLVAVSGIKGYVLVADENHATNALKEKSGIWLAAVIPSTEIDGDVDAEIQTMATLLFVLEKANLGQSNKAELDQYQRTQNALNKMRDYIADHYSRGCSPFTRYDPDSTVINPEYQIFSDRNGWSMTLVF